MSNCWVTKYVAINGWTFRVDTTLCDVIDAEISNRIYSSKGERWPTRYQLNSSQLSRRYSTICRQLY